MLQQPGDGGCAKYGWVVAVETVRKGWRNYYYYYLFVHFTDFCRKIKNKIKFYRHEISPEFVSTLFDARMQ